MPIDSAGNYNDGALRFGAQALTIENDAGVDTDYISETFSLTRGSNFVETMDENGVPNKQHGRPTIATGSATLQIETAATKLPKLFAEFTAVNGSSSSVTLVVSEVGEVQQHDGINTFTINIREVLN